MAIKFKNMPCSSGITKDCFTGIFVINYRFAVPLDHCL